MGYIKGRNSIKLDRACKPPWKGSVGNCKRGETSKSKVSPSSPRKQNQIARQIALVAATTALATGGTYIGAEALRRQGSVNGIRPASKDELDIVATSQSESLEVKKILGKGFTGTASLVVDKDGREYVKKELLQEASSMAKKVYTYSSSIEATVSAIAESSDVPVARVRMIPSTGGDKQGGTLQDLAEGETLAKLGEEIRKGNVPAFAHLQNANPHLAKFKKGGKYPSYKELDRANIEAMRDDGIAKIMALDTFVGNDDRHGENIFLDTKTGKVTAIDNGVAFLNDSVPKGVLKGLKRDEKSFRELAQKDAELKRGMQIYRDTLQSLIEKNPPKKVKSILLGYMQHESGQDIVNDFFKKTTKNMAVDSAYKDSVEIIKVLDKILK